MHRLTVVVLAGFAAVFVIFQATAGALGSDRGQWGLVIAAVVVAATVVYERVALRSARSPVVQAFRVPEARGMFAVAAVIAVLLAVPIVAAMIADCALRFEPGAALSSVGIFAQAGIAEETLFRSYLFGYFRAGRSFWRAAWLSLAPFAAVHAFLFWTMPWPVAAAALALSCVISFPLAWLWEIGGRTVWAPAILHAMTQGLIKVIVVSGPGSEAFPLIWMAACAVLPLFVLLVPFRPAMSGAAVR